MSEKLVAVPLMCIELAFVIRNQAIQEFPGKKALDLLFLNCAGAIY